MSLSVEAVAVAKKYTDNSIKGISGTLAGKNCTIKSIQKVDGVSTITFEWTADDGTVKTSTMNVMDGKDGIDGLNGKDGQPGTDGTDGIGISKIEKISTVDLVDTYRITFTDNSTFDYEVTNGKDGQGGGTADVPIEKIKVNGELQTPVNKVVDITVPDAYDDTDIRTELANKADTDHTHTTVNGHTVESDVPVDAKFTDTVYDDTQVKSQIQAVANGLMDSVGYSADYKTIDIIAKNGVKKSVNVAPIISHASITELSDVDTTNKATGKALVYNATTSKHEYADVSGTDEKVKMDASTDAKYLGELLDNVTIANENGELKVKKLDGQEVTITEINYLKGLTMNVMDLVNMFSNGGVKIINTPVATYAELLTLDKSSFIEGVSYLVYVLTDENHDNAKTTYLVDKDSETPTYFGFADSQRDFTTNPIDLATEITGKLGIANMDSDAIKALFTVDDTYKTETATNNAFSTHGAKALYDELLLAIGNKANSSDLTAHKDDTDIHVSTTEKDNWNGKANASDLTAHTDDADIHVTAENKATWNTVSNKVDKEDGKGLSANDYTNEEKALVGTIEDKINKTSIVTALDDTVTDEQVASALLTKTELDKKIDKTSIVTELSDASTDDEVVGALTVYNELQKLESSNKEQFSTASGDYITVNDSVDGNIIELGVKGNSFQQSYSGKNLLNATLQTTTYNGVTCTNNGDGTYTLNGEATNQADFLISRDIGLNGNFKVTGNPTDSSSSKYCLRLQSNNSWSDFPKDSIVKGTITNVVIKVLSGVTCNNVVFKPMITENLNATYDDFEPYVGGIPSPNPSYPQEIKSVGDDGSIVVKSRGKNMIPFPYYSGMSLVTNGITFTANEDGSVTANGTATSNAFFRFANKNMYSLENGKTYAISRGKTKDIYMFVQNSSGDFVVLKVDESAKFTCNDTWRYIGCYVPKDTTVTDETIYPMLVEVNEDGTYSTEYEQYKSSTTTIPLSEPLRAIGDVKDEITKDGIIRRIGTREYISGDELDSTIITDNTTTYYVLSIPTTEQLTNEQKIALNSLVSFKDKTYIETSDVYAKATLDLDYSNSDIVALVIESNNDVEKLKQAIVSLGGTVS